MARVDKMTQDTTPSPPPAPPSRRAVLGFVLLLGATLVVAGLHFQRDIEALINRVRRALPAPEAGRATPVAGPQSGPAVAATEAGAALSQPEAPEPEVAPAPQDQPTAQSELKAAYLSQFKPPRQGARLCLNLLGGEQMTGTLDSINEEGVVLSNKTVCVTVNRSRLTAASRAACYADDYMTFMLALNRKIAAEQQARDELVARMLADYKQALALKKTPRTYAASTSARKGTPPPPSSSSASSSSASSSSASSSSASSSSASSSSASSRGPATPSKTGADSWLDDIPWVTSDTAAGEKKPRTPASDPTGAALASVRKSATTTPPASGVTPAGSRTAPAEASSSNEPDVSVQDLDFRAYMTQHGKSSLLRERQQRIAEYEAERRAANREY